MKEADQASYLLHLALSDDSSRCLCSTWDLGLAGVPDPKQAGLSTSLCCLALSLSPLEIGLCAP